MAVTRRFASYVEFVISRGEESLKVDLALDLRFRFFPPIESEMGVLVNDLQDLHVDKLLAYYGRADLVMRWIYISSFNEPQSMNSSTWRRKKIPALTSTRLP